MENLIDLIIYKQYVWSWQSGQEDESIGAEVRILVLG